MRNAKILLFIFMAIIALQVETVSAAELPEGALPGVFNTGSRQVRFSIGNLWTSSSFLGGGLTCAFDLYFNSFIPEMYTYDMRCWGESVRLVMDIK